MMTAAPRSDRTTAARANRRTAGRLAVVVLAMFGFGYALVPLYDVLCEITGLGGRTGVVAANALDGEVDTSRTIKVQFLGTVSSRLPWEFRPTVASMEVHPGRVYETTYFAKNLSPGLRPSARRAPRSRRPSRRCTSTRRNASASSSRSSRRGRRGTCRCVSC